MLDPRKLRGFCNVRIFVGKLYKKNGRAPGNLLLLYEYNFKSSITILRFRPVRKYFFYLQSTKRTSLVTDVFVNETFFLILYHCCWVRFTENILDMSFRKKEFNEVGIIANCNRVHTKNCNHIFQRLFKDHLQRNIISQSYKNAHSQSVLIRPLEA